MQDPTFEDHIVGARAYEDLHVPALFKQWSPRVLDAAGVSLGHRVLDVACGTGVLAREAAGRVGSSGFVAGVDPGRGMLAVAKELAPHIEWTEGTAESLPYPSRTFDIVASQFGLMFFTDHAEALKEMTRVLKPGGRVAVAVWDSLENSEAYPIEVELFERLAGVAAANALRAPFTLGNRDMLETLFTDIGFTSVRIATHDGTARFPSIRTLVEADLRGWLPVMGVFLEEELVQDILEEAGSALADYETEEGQVIFRLPAHIVTGEVVDV